MDTMRRSEREKRNKTPLIAGPQNRVQAALDRLWAGRPMGWYPSFPWGKCHPAEMEFVG